MKYTAKILRLLTGLLAFLTTILAGLSSDLVNLLPSEWAVYVAIATTAALALKEFAVLLGDYLDDGKRNNSFNPDKKSK